MKNFSILFSIIFIYVNTLGPQAYSQFMGINTPVPLVPLHVSSHVVNPEQIIIRADGDDPNYATMMVNSTNASAISGYSILRNGVFGAMLGVNTSNDFFVKVGTNSPNAIYAKSSDNHVGINTANPLAILDVNGTLKLGTNGSVFTNLIKVSITVDVPLIPINSSIIQTFVVTNATVGGVVSISPDTVLPASIVLYNARVSAANTVEVTFRNTSQVTSSNPNSMVYHIAIVL
jgi:trimeric autotransporter adhesin